MLTRGKLVQDWRRRLAAAEESSAAEPRLAWLYQMRARLYRFLLSCYQGGDWRADEPSVSAEETVADASRGDTTTLLDCPLNGKPAKSSGKMLAVLKSVSAAQDHPAEAGPLLGGLAADEWVIVATAREELRINRCQDLLQQHGIASTWTLQDEILVRLFDLDRARQIIRMNREWLKADGEPSNSAPAVLVLPGSDWPARIAILVLFLAPIYSICGLLIMQCTLIALQMPLLEGRDVGLWFGLCYFATLEACILTTVLQDIRRRRDERERARRVVGEGRR